MTLTELKPRANLDYPEERADLAAAFRWTARLGMNEAVANHFSLAVSDDGKRFLINPNQRHFARIRASDACAFGLCHCACIAGRFHAAAD
jgi:ribulose-5-phosphate 4-epimerase/fuculose-1-phosphate aldolase